MRLLPLLLVLLVAVLAVTPRPAVSRRPSSPAAVTETLDVAGSLSRARAAVSTGAAVSLLHQSSKAEAQSASAAPGRKRRSRKKNKDKGLVTLRLHSRDFLPGEHGRHESYRSLVLSRLARDEARFAAVSARATLAADGAAADLRPANASSIYAASAAALRGPVVSGVGQGSGEYFSRVGVGSPPRQLYLVLDTGSDVTWVQCQPCADCYQQSDPVFDPSLSSSYAPVPCASPRCRALDAAACRNATGACLYEVAYGDGSYTVGDFATETITLGEDSPPVRGVAIGCGHDNEGLFVGAAGLLALGGGPLSFPSQISAQTFSYCLVDRDSPAASTLQFGDAPDPDAVAAPLLRSPRADTFYYVGLAGISVGGEQLSIPASAFAMDTASGTGGVIVDSGTAVTRLQAAAYAALRDAFVRGTPSLTRTSGVSLFDTCYDLSDRSSVEVPAVALRFDGGGTLRLPAKNYLIPVDGAGTYCLAFAPTNAAVSIIGNVQQQGTRVTFDTARNTVAFAANKC